MQRYNAVPENGIEHERTCARCDGEAMKGSRFCSDHATVATDGAGVVAVKTSDDSSIETDQAQIDDVVLERRSWNYAYIGEDVRGRHHHVDRSRSRIVVTKARAERDDSGAVPVFSLRGPILHAEGIVLASNGAGGDALRRWIQFIDQEIGDDDDESGWAERPVSAADHAQDILEEEL